MKNGPICTVSVAVVALGCAGAGAYQQSGQQEAQYFTMRTGTSTDTIRLDGDRLFGPDVEVSRLSDGFRGHFGNRVVDLRTADMKVYGSIGSAHTELYVEERPNGVVVKGLYGGTLGTIELLSDKVSGSIGDCTYDLVRAGAGSDLPVYTGRRACRGRVSSAEIPLPADLARRPAVDRAALMAMFLAQ